MTTGLFEKHAEKTWLSISQQSVDFVLLMSVATRSLDRWPRLAGGQRRRGWDGALTSLEHGAALGERPSVSGSHERAQCPARRRPRAAVVPRRPRLSGRLAFPWHQFPASPTAENGQWNIPEVSDGAPSCVAR